MRDLDLCCSHGSGLVPDCGAPASVWLRYSRRDAVYPFCAHHAAQTRRMAERMMDQIPSAESVVEVSWEEALISWVLLS